PGPTSFHLLFGVGQRLIDAQLGNDILSKASGRTSHLEALSIKQNLLHFGLANRWYTNNGFTWGVDWIQLLLPIGNSTVSAPFLAGETTEGAKSEVEKALAVFEYI